MAHPRPPAGAVPAGDGSRVDTTRLDTGVPSGTGGVRRALRSRRPRDDLLLRRHRRAHGVQRPRRRAGRRRAHPVSPPARRTRRLRPARHGRCAARQGRCRRVAVVAGAGCVSARRTGRGPGGRPRRGARRRRRVVGEHGRVPTRCSPPPRWASRSPTASSTTTRSTLRSGWRPSSSSGGRPARSDRASPPRSIPSCRTRGIASALERGAPESDSLNLEGHEMRIGLMIGSDKERERAERLAGLVADVQAADRAGFTSMWIPQIPGYLDAMTAIAVIGQVTEQHRARYGGRADPDPSPHPDGPAGADHAGGVRRQVHARPRAVAPLDRPGSVRPPVRAPCRTSCGTTSRY